MSSTSVHRPFGSAAFPWYDSVWLNAYEAARGVLRLAAPAKLQEFEAAMQVFRTPAGFEVPSFSPLFDAATMDEIRHIVATLDPGRLEMHEAREFRRFVVHDHPRFAQLHATLVGRMSEAAGEAIELRPTLCRSGEHQVFLGADFLDEAQGLVARLVIDPLGEPTLRVFRDDAPLERGALFTRADCARFELELERTGWQINDVYALRVRVDVDCESGEGDSVAGSVGAESCH